MPNIKFHQKAFGYVQICKVNATYTFEQFYLIESRLCVVRSALDHLEGDKFLVTEKKEETFLVSNTSKAARNSAAHSSLVEYLAQVINAKNCPTTFYCIFQLVWVPMSTSQNTYQGVFIRCGHVVRDFESEAKTRCNFQF